MALSPSRSSTASCTPVDAPEGTAARKRPIQCQNQIFIHDVNGAYPSQCRDQPRRSGCRGSRRSVGRRCRRARPVCIQRVEKYLAGVDLGNGHIDGARERDDGPESRSRARSSIAPSSHGAPSQMRALIGDPSRPNPRPSLFSPSLGRRARFSEFSRTMFAAPSPSSRWPSCI